MVKSIFFFLRTVAFTCNRYSVKTDGYAVQIFIEYSLVIANTLNMSITVQVFKMEFVVT